MVSLMSPTAKAIAAAAMRTMTITSVNCAARIRQGLLNPRSVSSFGPTSASRRSASAWLNPVSGEVSRASTTSSGANVQMGAEFSIIQSSSSDHEDPNYRLRSTNATQKEQIDPRQIAKDDHQGICLHNPNTALDLRQIPNEAQRGEQHR